MSEEQESEETEKDGQRSKNCYDYVGFDKTVYANNIKNIVREAPKNNLVQKMSLNIHAGTSLVVQWLRILLPMQGTWVRPLVWEDPTCLGLTKPHATTTEACALQRP